MDVGLIFGGRNSLHALFFAVQYQLLTHSKLSPRNAMHSLPCYINELLLKMYKHYRSLHIFAKEMSTDVVFDFSVFR